MRCLPLLCFLFAALTPMVRAGFDARLVPADARGLLSADLTTLRANPLGRELRSGLEPMFPDTAAWPKSEARSRRALATAVFLHGVSFSLNGEAGDGVTLTEGPTFRRQLEVIVERSVGQADRGFYRPTDSPFPADGLRSTTGTGEPPSPA